ncbi:MAG: hypothetical protein ACHQJ5_03180 [Vicinamibacteria bacterium]
MDASLDLAEYRAAAESFYEQIEREHYLQGAGHKAELELEPIYARHAGLFSLERVAELRQLALAAGGEQARGLRYLTQFALDGLLGELTRAEAEETARLESALEVEVDGGSIPYRQVVIEQANEPDADRRLALGLAQDSLLAERITPLLREALERSHSVCRELGWRGYADAYSDLRELDFAALAERTAGLLETTASAYPEALAPRLESAGLPPLGELRRSDLPRFFRAPELDAGFDPDRLAPALAETMAGLGIDLRAQANVHLDTDSRPTKSPRAFCSPLRVPDEVYLVVAPVGGREDFGAVMHEGGHTEHYANISRELPFEHRYLGDNGVTESFAFLFERLTEEPAWLAEHLGIEAPEAVLAHARAVWLLLVRRYCAKLAYERELHGESAQLDPMPARYAELLGDATGVAEWPAEQWLADVDPGFYVVCYLRAWALETHWRRALRERFGERWFAEPEAGRWLLGLWRHGQRLPAEELLADALGEQLDFGPLAAQLATP